jgi:hypothetical protein
MNSLFVGESRLELWEFSKLSPDIS